MDPLIPQQHDYTYPLWSRTRRRAGAIFLTLGAAGFASGGTGPRVFAGGNVGGGSPAGAVATEPPAVTGTLTYRERIALPPEATATVRLVDASLADAPAITLVEQTISPAGQIPIGFSLVYDPALIDPRNYYLVQGTITVGGQLLFTTTQSYPVLTRGAPANVDVVLQRP